MVGGGAGVLVEQQEPEVAEGALTARAAVVGAVVRVVAPRK